MISGKLQNESIMHFLRQFLFFLLLFSFSAAFGQSVYVTKTGTKYHLSGCRYLRKSSILMNRSDAIASGYSACSICRPGGGNSNTYSPGSHKLKSSSSSASTSTQCAGTTKKGSQCRRMTRSSNGYCWQHGGS